MWGWSRDAIHQRHPDVSEQQIETALLAREYLQRVGPIDRGDYLMPGIRERASGEHAQRLLVLGEQDAGHQLFFSTMPTNGSCR
jgi:hypothetical protein